LAHAALIWILQVEIYKIGRTRSPSHKRQSGNYKLKLTPMQPPGRDPIPVTRVYEFLTISESQIYGNDEDFAD